jgi:hypothetical protein
MLGIFRKRSGEEQPAAPGAAGGPGSSCTSFILVILDSCRYDTFMQAAPTEMTRLGAVEKRYSYASWTAPSHYNMLMGLMPHTSPKRMFASDYYRQDFLKFNERLGSRGIEFRSLVPGLYLPPFLRDTLGYHTAAMVSLPVLNSATPVNRGFDSWRLMQRHNDMSAMLDLLVFPPGRPSFYMLNVGETHYPYALPDEPEDRWPRISGVHGVFKHLDDFVVGGKLAEPGEPAFFSDAELRELRDRQVRAVKYLDGLFPKLFAAVPPGTWITVTSDHGELFGEDGYFGHGPVFHEKVFEVPFLEGRVP